MKKWMYRVDVYFDDRSNPEAWKALPGVLREIVKGFDVGCCLAWIEVPDKVMRGGEKTLHEYLVRVKSKLVEKGYKVSEFGSVEKIWDTPREPSEERVC